MIYILDVLGNNIRSQELPAVCIAFPKFYIIFLWHCRIYRVGQKKLPPYIFLFVVLLYLFTFTDNVLCELKFCPTYIEARPN